MYIEDKLQAEYHHLGLWYFIAFIAGIISGFVWFKTTNALLLCAITGAAAFASICVIFMMRKSPHLTFKCAAFILFSISLGITIAKLRIHTLDVYVIDRPLIANIKGIVLSLKPTEKGLRIILATPNIKVDGTAKIRLTIPHKYFSEISVLDQIRLKAQLFPPQSNSNLLNASTAHHYAYFAELSATGYALSKVTIIETAPEQSGFIHRARMRIYEKLIGHLGSNNGNFAAAILLGEINGIDKEILRNMRQSGLSHILCVSGLHLSLVAMIIFLTVRIVLNLFDFIAMRYNIKIIAAACALVGSYAYLELSGMHIAASRAFIMTAFFIIAVIFGRSCFPLRSLAIAASVLLTIVPEYIFHPSFQLSFIAVLSLIAGYEFYMKHKSFLGEGGGIINSLKLYFASNIYSSFLVSIIAAPVVVHKFFTFATYSIPANLIVVPVMSFCLMPLALLGLVLIPLGIESGVMKLAGLFIDFIIKVATYTNSLPLSVWYFGRIEDSVLLIFLFGFVWLALWQTNWRIMGIPVMIASVMLMFMTPKPDLMYDPLLKTFVTYDGADDLTIYTKKISTFNAEYITNWFGSKEARRQELQNMIFTTKSGMRIGVNYYRQICQAVDLQINLDAAYPCSNAATVVSHIPQDKLLLIFCDDKKCEIK